MRIKLHGNPFYLSIFQYWAVAFLEAPEQYHSNTFILLNFKVLLFIYLVCEEGHTYTHMYMYKSKHVAVITWRSWENVREPVLSFHYTGPGSYSGCQALWQVPLPTAPTISLVLYFIFQTAPHATYKVSL